MNRYVIGKVSRLEDGCFQWTVDDYLSRVYCDRVELQSPYFNFAGGCYFIRIKFDDSYSSFVSLRFSKKHESPVRRLHIKLGMRTGYRGKRETRSGEVDIDGKFAVRMWMTCSEMAERRLEILPDGILTIFCELRTLDMDGNTPELQELLPSETKSPEENEASDSDSDSEESVLQSKSVKKVLKGLKNLLISAEESDVVIKIQGKEFPAHRGILRVRSPVFNTMFSHDMVEKKTGVVEIEDCDPLTFPDFLNHIYTGSTKHVCAENVLSLYTASDKYDMQELKTACAMFMRNNFSIDTFCEITALAFLHSDNQLIKSATDFFCKAATEIIKTAKWHKFLRENPMVGNELFDKALSYSKNM